MRIILSIIILYVFNIDGQEEKKHFDYEGYLKNRFYYEINENTRIRYKKKQDVYDSLLRILTGPDSLKIAKANRMIAKDWPTGIDEFIDTLYTIHPNDTTVKHGLFLNFKGDTTYYTAGMYKDGLKDSVWLSISKNWGKVTVPYTNGKKNGTEIVLYPEGGKSISKYSNGTVIDTSFLYYTSGIIETITIYKNGRISKEICYEEDGSTMDCQEQNMR
jgi:antitoxin component YwqK of YwqJK toxin-antitoxin module